MNRRGALTVLASALGLSAARAQSSFPPVPKWQPPDWQPIERIVERFHYYRDNAGDFAVFRHGTIAEVTRGVSDKQARQQALGILQKVYLSHPDMTPQWMDDQNILVSYVHPVHNIVLTDIAQTHWAEIDRNHKNALAEGEVILTPKGQNVFDNFGKMALWGRCYMFMDAQDPEIARIERSKT